MLDTNKVYVVLLPYLIHKYLMRLKMRNKIVTFLRTFSIYLLLLIMVLFILPEIILSLKWTPIDSGGAREILITLASSQASIIAIVLALTLVAIQLTAEAYSLRVINVFRNDANLWILLIIYFLSIIYDILVSSVIENQPNSTVLNNIDIKIKLFGTINLEDMINFAIRLGIFAFMVLLIFILRTINLLNPREIIERLAKEIRINEFQNAVNEAYSGNSSTYSPRLLGERDQIIPLVEIIKRRLKEDDSTTAKICLMKLKDICCNIITIGGEREGIIRHFCEHFIKIHNFALQRNDEDSVIEIVHSLAEIGEIAINERLLEPRIWW